MTVIMADAGSAYLALTVLPEHAKSSQMLTCLHHAASSGRAANLSQNSMLGRLNAVLGASFMWIDPAMHLNIWDTIPVLQASWQSLEIDMGLKVGLDKYYVEDCLTVVHGSALHAWVVPACFHE